MSARYQRTVLRRELMRSSIMKMQRYINAFQLHLLVNRCNAVSRTPGDRVLLPRRQLYYSESDILQRLPISANQYSYKRCIKCYNSHTFLSLGRWVIISFVLIWGIHGRACTSLIYQTIFRNSQVLKTTCFVAHFKGNKSYVQHKSLKLLAHIGNVPV